MKIHNRKNEVRFLRGLASSIILIIFVIVSSFTLAEAQRNLKFQEQQKQWPLLWLYQFPYGRLTFWNDSLSTGLIFNPSFPSYFSLFTDTSYLSILPAYYDLVRSPLASYKLFPVYYPVTQTNPPVAEPETQNEQSILLPPIWLPDQLPTNPPPFRLRGGWRSHTFTDGWGNSLKGELSLDREGPQVLLMLNSPLSLRVGVLVNFQTTFFQVEFSSGYSGDFTGTVTDSRCPPGAYCCWAGLYSLKGEYTIRDNAGQVVDSGTFSLQSPGSSYNPSPNPDKGITVLGQPVDMETGILSLTTGPDGLIYGGTGNGIKNGEKCKGHMFVYDLSTGQPTDLGDLGYECAVMTTGADGLIYIGGGTRYPEKEMIGYPNLAVYNPAKAWQPGPNVGDNPLDLGKVGNFADCVGGYAVMVHDLVAAKDGRIYGCTGIKCDNIGARDDLYAHLFVYDPQTDTITDLGQPISEAKSITSLAQTQEGTIYGVVRPSGQMFSYHPSSQVCNLIDLPTNYPCTGSGVNVLTAGNDGFVYGAACNASNIFVYNPISHSFRSKGYKLNFKNGGKIKRMICDDWNIYLGCGGNFGTYNPAVPTTGKGDSPGDNPRIFAGTHTINSLTIGLDGQVYLGTDSGYLLVYQSAEEEDPTQNEEPDTLHIADNEISLVSTIDHISATAKVKVVNSDWTPVQGARVSGHFSGLVNEGGFCGYTNNKGLGVIYSPRVNSLLEGEFCFEVDDISKPSGWTYVPEPNSEINSCIHTSGRVAEVIVGACLDEGQVKGDPDDDDGIFRAEYSSGQLHVLHLGAWYHCCLDTVEVTMSQQGHLIQLFERGVPETSCDCKCHLDVEIQIKGLSPGTYTIEIYRYNSKIAVLKNVTI